METRAPEPEPIDVNAITKLIRDELDLDNKYFDFAQTQAEKDRAYFKHLYGHAIAFLVFMVAVASYFSYSSVSQMRADIDKSVTSALENVHIEVKNRIDTEFRRENITAIVSEAAKERTQKELAGVIRSETAIQVASGIKEKESEIKALVEAQTAKLVDNLEPAIKQIVYKQTEDKVKAALIEVSDKIASFGEFVRIGNLTTLARNDDRASFDYLIAVATGDKPEIVKQRT